LKTDWHSCATNIANPVDPELGVLTWEGDLDIAPETLYADATGSPLPDWMTPNESPASMSPQPTHAKT